MVAGPGQGALAGNTSLLLGCSGSQKGQEQMCQSLSNLCQGLCKSKRSLGQAPALVLSLTQRGRPVVTEVRLAGLFLVILRAALIVGTLLYLQDPLTFVTAQKRSRRVSEPSLRSTSSPPRVRLEYMAS